MLLVGGHVSGVDEDVIQVYYNPNIQKICKDSIYKVLKCCQSVGEAKGHH